MKVELPDQSRKERREVKLGEVHWTPGLGAGRGGGLEGLGVGVPPAEYLQPPNLSVAAATETFQGSGTGRKKKHMEVGSAIKLQLWPLPAWP